MKQERTRLEELMVVHPNAAGLDIGAREIWVCVPPDREGETVRSFGTFTPDLAQLATWLEQHEVVLPMGSPDKRAGATPKKS